MTNPEFFEEFDILYNSICSNQAPGLDPYEKSVLLTEAQEDFVRECYSGAGSSFEINESVRRSLDSLVRFATIAPTEEAVPIGGTVYNLPEDLWIITYEEVELVAPDSCLDGTKITVVPTTQDEYNRIKKNPFRGPTRNKVLRLDIGTLKVSLVSSCPVGTYIIGYIVKPPPIILYDLDEGLSIDGEHEASECTLNSYTHRYILEKAVTRAAAIYKNNQKES